MSSLTFRRFVVSLVTITMLSAQFFWPGRAAVLAAGLTTATANGTWTAHRGACDPFDPDVRAGRDATCRLVHDSTGAEMAYPTINWVEVATLTGSAATGYSLSHLGGDKLHLSDLRSESMLNIAANKAADMVNTYPTGVPVVMARYNPGTAELRIDLFKSEKVGTGLKLMNAVFSPHNGGMWAANGSYASPEDRAAGKFGPNPFARFANPNDDVFHNISEEGVTVAVGHAMRNVQAAVGMIAVADYRIQQWTTTKKSLLKKKVTQHIAGYAKPIWKMATPAQFQPRGATAAICAIGTSSDACPAYAVAPAMIKVDTWTGGNLDEREDLLYSWQKTYSGWTVLAFVLLAFVMAFAIAAIAVAAGFTASSTSFVAQMMEGMIGNGVQLGVTAVAGIQAAVYGVVAAVQGGSLTDIQDGFGGKIIGTGDLVPAAPQNEHQAALVANTNARMTQSAIDGSLIGVRQTAYGNCSLTNSGAACGGTTKGLLPRSDSYVGHDYVEFYRDNGAPVRYDGGVGALQ